MVFWINWWLKTCEKPKRLRSFLVFCMDCFYMSSKNLSKKPKKTWVVLVFWLTSSKSSFKKPKKPWVFLVFQGHDQKKPKKTRGKPKKPNMSLRPNILWKVLVFWFFGFLEVFWFLVFSRFSQQGAQNLRSRNVRSVFDIGVAIMFFFGRHISKKNTFHYRPLVSTISLCKRLSPKYVRQFILNFFLWRPDFFKGK